MCARGADSCQPARQVLRKAAHEIKLIRAVGTLSSPSLGGEAGRDLGIDYPSAYVLVGVSRVRADPVTHGPATPETLTCTKWTGPLGLKRRRHRVNFWLPLGF